jgi:valyl-tRNA synthetase
MLHEDTIPWQHVVVSGWILDPDRKKMSKSKGNVVTPDASARRVRLGRRPLLGGVGAPRTDTAFDDKVFKVGKRLVTKIFNAGKFVLQQEGDGGPIDRELDRAFVERLRALVERVTALYDEFEYAHALQETRRSSGATSPTPTRAREGARAT